MPFAPLPVGSCAWQHNKRAPKMETAPLEAPLAALEAAGLALGESLGVLKKGFEDRHSELHRYGDAWRHEMAEIAVAESACAESIAAKRQKVAQDRQSLQQQLKALERERANICRETRCIEGEINSAAARACEVVPLSVGLPAGGQVAASLERRCFEVSAHVLRRSKWFADRLESYRLPSAGENAGQRKRHRFAAIMLDKDPELLRVVLNCLRDGLAYVRSLLPLDATFQKALCKEACFFEIGGLVALLAEPPVGSAVKVQLSSLKLHSQGVEDILFHTLCGRWHAPGRCCEQQCRREGTVLVDGVVQDVIVESSRDGGGEPELQWVVKCFGEAFRVHEVQLSSASCAPASNEPRQDAAVYPALVRTGAA
eukprot:TRINITY_DN22191_c0_g1_i2.p1 TRINITY_DN22191_c0_g1~~TRINITY_DN22191_c0_g1_i2.p1  ORF type:complete len:370 (+),score=76.57 TRINITY_DN22191_c0_g1_i2:70-1179(+)